MCSMSSVFFKFIAQKKREPKPTQKKENNIVAGSNLCILSIIKKFVNTFKVKAVINSINKFLRYIYMRLLI